MSVDQSQVVLRSRRGTQMAAAFLVFGRESALQFLPVTPCRSLHAVRAAQATPSSMAVRRRMRFLLRLHPRAPASVRHVRPHPTLDRSGPEWTGYVRSVLRRHQRLSLLDLRFRPETERGTRCARCVLRDRLATEFLSSSGEVPAEVRPLIDALVRAPKARSILVWLDKPHGGAACLRRLVDDDLPLTHETLDSVEPGQGTASLRATLVHLSVLPTRNEPLAGLQP
ncbi:hypothetical protein [Streptomyces pseudovenezuelae]|uniref:Uncharacterized protein n=1 Tax=Streptomyces pseudovenezuelae TaxID=67350 RepID=A0ABZ1X9K7_9ACTN|nr:hypothetical protein [Streptomyces pseudovenezuelae]